MFKVGDLVKVVDKGVDLEGVEGMLVVNHVINDDHWAGSPLYEVRNAEGDYFGLVGNALESI